MAVTGARRRVALRHARRVPVRRRDRRTLALGVVAVGTTAVVAGGELARVWRKGSAPLPAETDNVLEAAERAARETVEVAVVGYQQTSDRETALLNLLAAFTLTFGIARLSVHTIRARGSWGPFRDWSIGPKHIHHFVPGILLAFLAGGASIVSRDESLDQWFAIPFGAGLALTLDESALLLELDDVYWTEAGIVSVQITLGALALLSTFTLALRLLRRGEARVLPDAGDPP
ncbi:MAG: hypothetical protein QOI98_2437 [Solirubrobacteraceae bacterium]|nr:hypothetical protein [Solirubrobacteraceae bacterium]